MTRRVSRDRSLRAWSILAVLWSACGGGYELTRPDQTYYLQTNLRATSRGIVSSVLGWRGTDVVPVCTPVRVTAVESREIAFEDIETGERFRYVLHRSTRLGVEAHLNRYFGTSCAPEVDHADVRGIEEGLVEVGMTRPGVLVALGYPPEHRTPSLEDPVWTYWGETGRVVVAFDGGGRVVSIADERGRPIAGLAPMVVEPSVQPGMQPGMQPGTVVTQDGELTVVDGSTLPVDADGTVVVEGSASISVQAPPVEAPVEATIEVAPERDPRAQRRRRRRRLRTAGIIVGAAAVTTGVAVAAHRANRASSEPSAAPAPAAPAPSAAPAPAAAPTPTVVRQRPAAGRLFDRCGGGTAGCGSGLTCDAASNQCRVLPGTLGEAPPCREDRECPTGHVCGVSRLTPERGPLCWQPDVVGR